MNTPDLEAQKVVAQPVDAADVEMQLRRILASERFVRSERCAAFLKFVVEEALAGRSACIKARSISISVFQRKPDENSPDDPIVRIQAGRLRRTLDRYYKEEGARDAIHISIPTGAYVPVFRASQAVGPKEASPVSQEPMRRAISRPRIAMLAFANLGDREKYDYFADGLGEQLSSQLARFQGLAVLDYWTTSQIRSTPADSRRAVRDLAIDFIVTGSVVRSGNRVRVNVRCVDVATDNQIWTERFDRQLTVEALFDIQDEIVSRVVACVGDSFGSVSRTLHEASQGKPVDELTAYEAVLGVHHYQRSLTPETHDRTRAALERAVVMEPSYALAWAMLCAVYCDIHAHKLGSLDVPLAQAEHCAQRAMVLDQSCQYAHYASALAGVLKRDHSRIIAACDEIVRLNPNAAFLVGAASVWLGITGRFDQALPLFERSLELNPYHPGWFHFLPWLHAFVARDFESALAATHRFNMPQFYWDPLLRSATLGKLGREEEAAEAFQELLRLRPDFSEFAAHHVECFVHADAAREDVFDGLRVAGM